MWGRKRKAAEEAAPGDAPPGRLKEAIRQARIETAERSNVVVDLRDAEFARLELLNDALEPLFGEVPPEVELFDRGISRGDPPRLWIDVVTHVFMARDKRHYRFVQDTRFGRKVLAESAEIPPMVDAITHYVANRLVERERALADEPGPWAGHTAGDWKRLRRARRWRLARIFLFGLIIGVIALFTALWIEASRLAQ